MVASLVQVHKEKPQKGRKAQMGCGSGHQSTRGGGGGGGGCRGFKRLNKAQRKYRARRPQKGALCQRGPAWAQAGGARLFDPENSFVEHPPPDLEAPLVLGHAAARGRGPPGLEPWGYKLPTPELWEAGVAPGGRASAPPLLCRGAAFGPEFGLT